MFCILYDITSFVSDYYQRGAAESVFLVLQIMSCDLTGPEAKMDVCGVH